MATSIIRNIEPFEKLNPSSGSGYIYFSNAMGNVVTSNMMPLIDAQSKIITLLSVTLPDSNTVGVSRFSIYRRKTGFAVACNDEVSRAACENKMCYIEFSIS